MELGTCFNLAVRKTSRLINQFYDDRLSGVQLNTGQFSLLRTVFFCKETNNKQLQNKLTLDQTTLSRNLKPLLRDGLLKLQIDENDRRLKIISLTSVGKERYLKALPIWEKAQKELHRRIGEKDSEKILSLANNIVKKFAV